MKIKIALTPHYLNLLNLKHTDDTVTLTMDRLNHFLPPTNANLIIPASETVAKLDPILIRIKVLSYSARMQYCRH